MRLASAVAAVALVIVAPAAAPAEVVLTPYAGRTFSGDATEEAQQYGGSVAFLGSLLGFEVDAAYTPDFFGDDPAFVENNVTTLMGSLVVGPQFADGRGRFYVAGGAGLVKTRVEDADSFFDVDQNDFGLNAGGGVTYFFGEKLGVRGDVRYFRDLRDPDPDDEFDVEVGDFNYWRGAVGLSLRF